MIFKLLSKVRLKMMKKPKSLADFVLNTSEADQNRIMEEVVRKANERQRKTVGM